jgi:hypothetical protein
MNANDYIQHIKKLLKTYHPDLCPDKKLINTYNEITIKLNLTLNQLENREIKINETLSEDKNFNMFSFRYYLSKIQSIGINRNSALNKDYIIFRNFLVSEINKDNEKIGGYFSLLLSDNNIKNDAIEYFANGYANYNSIFQNYYQYKKQNVKGCITVGDSYFNDYIRKSNIPEINNIIEDIKKWIQEKINELYNQQYCT